MTTLFISDLHLTPERPNIVDIFLSFLQGEARNSDALYILGDLFEYWIGDDAAAILGYESIIKEMRSLSESGVPVYYMRGNRDFLVGDLFERESGCQILSDPTVVDLYGDNVLLTHGDYLCTDDKKHQQFRMIVDDPLWRESFLSQPIDQRIEEAKKARQKSEEHKSSVSMEIMDVNLESVLKSFDDHQVKQMIHGHTHRPGVHQMGERKDLKRTVLGDWYNQSSILRYNAEHQELDPHPTHP